MQGGIFFDFRDHPYGLDAISLEGFIDIAFVSPLVTPSGVTPHWQISDLARNQVLTILSIAIVLPPELDPMQLTYRGVRYTPTSFSPATLETDEQGIFLGAPFKFKAQMVCPIKRPSKFLKYRGVLYIR